MSRLFILLQIMILWQQNIFALDWREEYCSEDRVCLIYEQNGYTVDLYLQNKFITDDIITTVTLAHTAEPVNLTGQAPLPATMVCRGTKPLKAASFTIIDYSKAWNTNLNYYWQYGAPASTEDTKYAYELPFEKGRRFRVCQAFNDTLTHSGESAYAIDWQMPAGTPICAARSGVVIYTVTKYSTGGLTPAYKNKDNLVIILHSDGSMARYAHMKHNGVTVQTGDRVEAGSVIAYSGNTGYSASPHLHFDIFRPLDGKNSATIPFGFITDYADYEVPEKGGFYTFTGASPKKPSASMK